MFLLFCVRDQDANSFVQAAKGSVRDVRWGTQILFRFVDLAPRKRQSTSSRKSL